MLKATVSVGFTGLPRARLQGEWAKGNCKYHPPPSPRNQAPDLRRLGAAAPASSSSPACLPASLLPSSPVLSFLLSFLLQPLETLPAVALRCVCPTPSAFRAADGLAESAQHFCLNRCFYTEC